MVSYSPTERVGEPIIAGREERAQEVAREVRALTANMILGEAGTSAAAAVNVSTSPFAIVVTDGVVVSKGHLGHPDDLRRLELVGPAVGSAEEQT